MEQTDKTSVTNSLQPQEVLLPPNKSESEGTKTIMCSVLFLDIVAYSRKSVSQQMVLKNCLNNALAAAISMVPTDDRIILDTGDGAAISFLGDVKDALRVALMLRESLLYEGAQLNTPLPARMGINLGPVRLIKDINGEPNIVGDGINVAQRVMEFSEAGQILISRSYYDAISGLSHEYAGMLHYHGKFTDQHVREHEVYAVGRKEEIVQPTPAANIDENVSLNQDAGSNRSIFETVSSMFEKASSQPRILIGGIFLGVLLLVAARMIKVEPQTALPAQSKELAPAQQGTVSAESAVTALPQVVQIEQESPIPTKNFLKPQMATVSIAVTPWGEVYLDGVIQGISPPLTELKIKPGNHKIEIRNKTFKEYSQDFLVKAGGRIAIKYKFASPQK